MCSKLDHMQYQSAQAAVYLWAEDTHTVNPREKQACGPNLCFLLCKRKGAASASTTWPQSLGELASLWLVLGGKQLDSHCQLKRFSWHAWRVGLGWGKINHHTFPPKTRGAVGTIVIIGGKTFPQGGRSSLVPRFTGWDMGMRLG